MRGSGDGLGAAGDQGGSGGGGAARGLSLLALGRCICCFLNYCLSLAFILLRRVVLDTLLLHVGRDIKKTQYISQFEEISRATSPSRSIRCCNPGSRRGTPQYVLSLSHDRQFCRLASGSSGPSTAASTSIHAAEEHPSVAPALLLFLPGWSSATASRT